MGLRATPSKLVWALCVKNTPVGISKELRLGNRLVPLIPYLQDHLAERPPGNLLTRSLPKDTGSTTWRLTTT